MTDNPYESPTTADPSGTQNDRLTAPSKVLLALTWVVWGFLLIGYFADLMVLVFGYKDASVMPALEQMESSDLTMIGVLAFTATVTFGLVFLVRWVFFRLIIHPNRAVPGNWPAALFGILGMLIVYAMIKSVETYGMTLFFMSKVWVFYAAFAIPSLVLMIAHIPVLMLDKRVVRGVD